MFKFIFIFLIFLVFNNAIAKESLLTLKQQIDRLQREVSDLNKVVNKGSVGNGNIDLSKTNLPNNLTAFDLRIYDLEKDIKKLNENLEEIIFQIDDLKALYENLETNILKNLIEDNIIPKDKDIKELSPEINKEVNKENTLGNLVISSEDLSEQNNQDEVSNSKNIDAKKPLLNFTPEEQFQAAFDLLRSQQFGEAQIALRDFIKKNESNRLAGSAHYWLGELYLLKKDYREAALILAEGYQKHSNSIKAPEILYKLSLSLKNIGKNKNACNTLKKLINEFPDSKIVDKAQSEIISQNCNFVIK